MKVRQNLQTAKDVHWQVRFWTGLSLVLGMVVVGCDSSSGPSTSELPPTTGARQVVQPMEVCATCHSRQYRETLQSVKSGYRAISPALNSLELAGNLVSQPLFEAEAIRANLRPTYDTDTPPDMLEFDVPVRTGPNMLSAQQYNTRDDFRSGFCIGCHNGALILEGEQDLASREVPEWQARFDPPFDPDNPGFVHPRLPVIRNVRPLRDYHFVDVNGDQVLPDPVGSLPANAFPSRGSQAVLCDHCHNVQGPDTRRSLKGDGFANVAQEIDTTRFKVGPLNDARPVGRLPIEELDPRFLPRFEDTAQNFHASSGNQDRINYLRSSKFCIACHDVRVPNPDLVVPEGNTSRVSDPSSPIPPGQFRLENLGTEWATQPYAFEDHASNPFGQVVRCQDCHMSLFPYSEQKTYRVRDEDRDVPRDYEVTSPVPGQFPINKAAGGTNPTGMGLDLPDRQVVTHYMTGVDVPLVYTDCNNSDALRNGECVGELRERLGPDRPPIDQAGVDEYGIPRSLEQRRTDLLRASIRLFLDDTDNTAQLGHTFRARVTAIALTGHNFPSGFSQERTTWIELTVSAPATFSGVNANLCNNTNFIRANNESQFCTPDGEFILYQSGYRIDKPHPETLEMAPDGRLDDEDNEHLIAVVNPFNHHNEVFEEGTDNGPVDRIFFGAPKGLVLFRNELLRFYGPECLPLEGATPEQQMLPNGRSCGENRAATGIPDSNRRHPRTGEVLTHVLEEETFSAGVANAVDNWRALPPLDPKTFLYEVELPTPDDLMSLGITITGPLRVRATVHFLHFPPLFLRFLSRVAGAVPYAPPPEDDPNAPYTRVPDFDAMPINGYMNAIGLRGPADFDFRLFDEKRIDDLLRNVPNLQSVERCIPLDGVACPASPQGVQASQETQRTAQR